MFSGSKHRSNRKKYLFILLAAGLLLVGVLVALEATDTTHFFHKRKPVATTGSQYTKGIAPSTTPNATSTSQGQPSSETSNTNVKQPEGSTVSPSLAAPWGTFANVYNAHYNDQMGSTCNTTPGATCQIIFTMGDQTRSLSTETTDAGGAVYWTWKPSDINLTPGVWHITAKAVLGSATKTTNNDPLTLTINP